MLGVKSLDALGRINTSAYAFRNDRTGAFRQLDTATTTPKIEEILSDSSQSLTRRLATLWTAAT